MSNENFGQEINDTAVEAVTADSGYPTEPGLCARFVRLVVGNAIDPSYAHPQGLDAKQACQWYSDQGYEVDKSQGTIPGDVIGWDNAQHGPHGHIAIRVVGNRVAENSSFHSHDGSDARGYRSIFNVDQDFRVFRIVEDVA